MKRNEILQTLRDLAKGQGFYSGLLRDIENAGNRDEILDFLENKNFADAVDLTLYFEQ